MTRTLFLALLLVLAGCGTEAAPLEPATDATEDTAGGSTDTEPDDTSEPDPTDTAPTDAAPTDTAPGDAEPVDAEPPDTAPSDVEPPEDTVTPDTPPMDTSPPDAEPPEDGGPADVEPDAPECVDGEESSVEVFCEDGPARVFCECVDGTWQCTPDPCAEEPPPCSQDSECSAANYCDECATSSCPDCDDCIAGCLPHGCPTEAAVTCRRLRPDCGPTGVAVAVDGCWQCVDSETCEPEAAPSDCELAGATCFDSGCPVGWDRIRSSCGTRASCCVESEPTSGICDDGTVAGCFMEEPTCSDSEIVAVQDSCWVCVNPATCLPWGEAECASNRDCEAGEVCDECGTSSCPACRDCIAACVEL